MRSRSSADRLKLVNNIFLDTIKKPFFYKKKQKKRVRTKYFVKIENHEHFTKRKKIYTYFKIISN